MNQLATIDGDVQMLGEPEATSNPPGSDALPSLPVIMASISRYPSSRNRARATAGNSRLQSCWRSPNPSDCKRAAFAPTGRGRCAQQGFAGPVTLKNGRSMVLTRLELDNEPARIVLRIPTRATTRFSSSIVRASRAPGAVTLSWSAATTNCVRRSRSRSISFARHLPRAPHCSRHCRLCRRARVSVLAPDHVLAGADDPGAWIQGAQHILLRGPCYGFGDRARGGVPGIRQFLIIHLTARVDVKLNTYIFDKLIGLPIDFFERNQIGGIMTVYYYHQRILSFLTGQLLGSLLDSTVLMFFLPVMFFLSPLVTTFILVICAIIVSWLVFTLPIYRRKGKWLETLQSERGSFLYQTLAGIRTVKALTLEPRQRHRFDALTHKVAKSRIEHDLFGAVVSTVVRPLEMTASWAVWRSRFIWITTEDPTLTAALFAFLLLSQRVIQPLIQIAMSLNQWDDARIAIEAIGDLVNRPEEEGRSREGPRPTVHGKIEFQNATFTYRDAGAPALREVSFTVPPGTTLGLVGRSGSGKTTVTRLLQRLSPSYQGQIRSTGSSCATTTSIPAPLSRGCAAG